MSWGAIFSNTVTAIQRQTDALTRLQEQVSSGNRINRPSDDPVDASRIMNLLGQDQTLDSYLKNISTVTTDLDQGATTLQHISDLLTNAKGLLTQAASGTYSTTQRELVGEQINEILEEVVASINQESLGRYVFSGASNTTAPYLVERSGDRIVSATYQGSYQKMPVPVAPGVAQSGVSVGAEIFGCDERRSPTFLGSTGAAGGSGTSSVRGDAWLSITHEETTLTQTSGMPTTLAVGASSASLDTILGDHTVSIDADAQTVRLDGGPAVSYTALDTDLKVSNADGDCVYLDMSQLTAGISGLVEVAVHASARLSIDDGQSSILATFQDNQMVTDSRDGRVLCVNTTGLTRVGVEAVRVGGTYDLLGTLIRARDLLNGNQDTGDSDVSSLLIEETQSLEEVMSGVMGGLTSLGARAQGLENLRQSITSIQGNAKDRASELQGADIATIAAELARVQTFYEMILTSSSKIMNMSLLDYLR
ncbi:MAG: flagellar hook-associated protein FlgL [Phycisphaerae bacterium]|jgi:flagellar hook-associated protein 3 FlgL